MQQAMPGYRHKQSVRHPEREEHVFDYRTFKAASVYHIISTLSKMGMRPTKREKS